MLTYVFKSALLLSLLYGSFALLLSRETFHRFNRVALLCVLVASLVLPVIKIEVPAPLVAPAPLPIWESVVVLPDRSASTGESVGSDVSNFETSPQEGSDELLAQGRTTPSLEETGEALYLLGVLVSVAIFCVGLFRLFKEIRGGMHTKDEQGNTVVIRGGDFAPFSFLHYIIISASDYEHLRQPIMAHEQAHIRLGHTWDLLLLEAVKALQWFNPFIYLLGRDLKAVHEYEADDAVLSFGIDAKTYQLLLVTKAVGSRLQTVCNNLSHHSLKKRIKMMHKNKSNRWLMG